MVKNDRTSPATRWTRRLKPAGTHRGRFFVPALLLVYVLLLPTPVTKDLTSSVTLKSRRAQELIDQLRAELPIGNDVQIAVVTYDPLVFSVQPLDKQKDRFLLKMELGFLLMLDDDELRAAMAHELGHVWIYTHHPFLQTERLANVIGERVADRASFESIYSKLWAYEGTSGVPIESLLGPPSSGGSDAGDPVAGEARP